LHARLKAAAADAPFVHPKLAVIVQTTTEDLVERMQHALEARMKVVNARPTEVKELPKPAEPKSEAQQVSEAHMKRPMTTLDVSRFRRI